MGETRHTPGPWHATNHFADDAMSCNCAYVLSEGYAGSICDISVGNGLAISDGGNDAPPRDEAAANARLIAAAPDLLAALLVSQKEACGDWCNPNAHSASCDNARAAIAKATTPATASL